MTDSRPFPFGLNANLLRSDQLDEVKDWVTSLGVEPNDVRPQLLIEMGEKGYRLHLSRFVLNADGKKILDRAANEVVSEPLILELGTEQTWPAWLADAARAQAYHKVA
jgi:hypothetical protein